MHERAGELDQPFVKIPVNALPVSQPQIFQNIMRLIKKLAVKAVEIAKIMRVEFLSLEGFDHRGDAGAFVTHGGRLKSKDRSPKVKVLLRNQAEEAAAVGWRKRQFVVQVGQVERGRVRFARPENQVLALLQRKLC